MVGKEGLGVGCVCICCRHHTVCAFVVDYSSYTTLIILDRGIHSIDKFFCILVVLKRTGLLKESRRAGEFFCSQSLLGQVLLLCPGCLQWAHVRGLFIGGGRDEEGVGEIKCGSLLQQVVSYLDGVVCPLLRVHSTWMGGGESEVMSLLDVGELPKP